MTPHNPYRSALAWIAGAGLGAGLLMIFVGIGIAGQRVSVFDDADPMRGLPQTVLGGSMAGLGLIALLLWLTVSAIGWRAVPKE